MVFQGHQIVSLAGTLLFAGFFLLPIIFKKLKIMPKIGRGMKFWDYVLVYLYAILIPNSTYAFFELRHLIFIDLVADTLTPLSFLVFGGISLIGLLTTIWGIRLVVDHYAKSKRERLLYTLVLSLICSFGAVVGVMQYASYLAMIFPPVLILAGLRLLLHPHLIVIALVTAGFLLILNLLLDHINKPT
jgi:hypothetical protein